ncbi:MAG: OmpA family protein [Bacteroidales bacterium]|nr:OmpA family protein [Bacteroidales bacterium]MBN2758565.1 OmpA family protein [Bacteroidales bacterium]
MKTLLGIFIFIIWTFISIEWYVCGIKELCKTEEIEKPVIIKNTPNEQLIKKDSTTVKFDFENLTIYFPFSKTETEISDNLKDSIFVFVNNIIKSEKYILISGHTDNIGSSEKNIELGLKRALWIKNLFVLSGLNQNQIEIKSNGENQPIDKNNTEAGRSKNRRVEISIKQLN